MTLSLTALLVSVAAAAPSGSGPRTAIREHHPDRNGALVRLESAEQLARLCRALEPVERLRLEGDAVERGEAAARHASARDAAIAGRYEVVLPAAALAFAPYDGPERRLALQEPVQLPVGDGSVRLWPTEERSLAVNADAAAARRVLEARRSGSLGLALVFDLPDDASCGVGARGSSFTIPVEPVSWSWVAGDAVLAAGGAAADRPIVTAAQGARPRVAVGEPIAGPAEAKLAVLARAADLEACYAAALERDPGADGVLVADFGGAYAAIAADSVGDAELADCVRRVVGPLAPAHGGRAAVPIRFELTPPGEQPKLR